MFQKLKITAFVLTIVSAAALSYGQIKVACAGTSVTAVSQYPEMLQKKLGSGYTVYNKGAGGGDASGCGWNYYLKTSQAAEIFSLKPQIIVMEFGANDAHCSAVWIDSNYCKKYGFLIDTFLTIKPQPQIWVAIPPPTFPPEQADWITCLAHIRTETQRLITLRNQPWVDFYTPLANHREYWAANDGCHPPVQGAAADTMARIVYRALSLATPVVLQSNQYSAKPKYLTGNGQILSIQLPAQESWKLDLVDLSGTRIARYSGTGSSELVVASLKAQTKILIAHLQTSANEAVSKSMQFGNY